MAFLAAGVVFTAILSGAQNLRASSDQRDYHWVVIEQFSRQFPRPDLSDYRSATSPGYHLAIAAIHRWVTQDERTLRLLSGCFTVALLALLAGWTGMRMCWTTAAAVCLPVLTSLYVFGSAVWLLPDNLAWLTVLAALLLAYREQVDARTYAGAAVVLTAAVLVRQINFWPLGVLTIAVALSSENAEPDGQFTPPVSCGWARRAGLMLLAGVPAMLVLATFYRLWHGLTPPAFQHVEGPLPPGHSGWQHEGPNPAVPAMVLALLGATGVFFSGFLWPTVRTNWSGKPKRLVIVLLGVAVGGAASLVVPTNFNHDAGRYSGLWNLSARFPVIGPDHDRSLFIAALAAAGGAVVTVWFLALGRRDRWIWLATWVCFILAQSANAMAWQKYYEPFCLIMLALAASRVAALGKAPRWAIAGPVALAAVLAGVTLWSLKPTP